MRESVCHDGGPCGPSRCALSPSDHCFSYCLLLARGTLCWVPRSARLRAGSASARRPLGRTGSCSHTSGSHHLTGLRLYFASRARRRASHRQGVRAMRATRGLSSNHLRCVQTAQLAVLLALLAARARARARPHSGRHRHGRGRRNGLGVSSGDRHRGGGQCRVLCWLRAAAAHLRRGPFG